MNEQPTNSGSPQVVPPEVAGLWFLGTYAQIKLEAKQTGGRLGVFEIVLPKGAAPPLHSHPQDESFYVLDGKVTGWLVEIEDARKGPEAWVRQYARPCEIGSLVYAPGGTPHSFRVESNTARMLFLSTPAGVEEYIRGLGEPAEWPWLQPPSKGPRVTEEKMREIEQKVGMVRYGPSPR